MINIKDLHFNYPHKSALFNALSLEIGPGHIIGLLGKNGAGKSTLMRLIAGLNFPSHGKISVHQYPSTERDRLMLEEIFYLGEEFHTPSLSPETYGKTYGVFYPRFDQAKMKQYLKTFEVESTCLMDQLSFGQRKKTMIAFALASNCKLLLLDEPSNGLDIPSKSQFRKVLSSAIDQDKTFIISTHQVRDVENMLDQMMVIDQGEIALYQNLSTIAKTLIQIEDLTKEQIAQALFTEPGSGGLRGIMLNASKEESNFDFELLFNTILENKQKMHRLFEGETL